MDDVILCSELSAQGYSRDEVRRMRRNGELISIRRGAYAKPAGQDLDARAAHQQLIMASLPMITPGSVVSHQSAALLHSLPLWKDRLQQVHFTRDRSSGGRKGHVVHLHSAPLTPLDVTEMDGLQVTSLARTVVDLARSLPYQQAVSAGDQALAFGLAPEQLEHALLRARHWPGVAAARRVAAFIDGRSESPGESLSRVVLAELGLLPVELQYEVFNGAGNLVGRSDFCWPEHKTLGEFDGKIKYGRLLKPGQSASDVVFAEKVREDLLRDLGWQVVRWIWADLSTPRLIGERLQRAFVRSQR